MVPRRTAVVLAPHHRDRAVCLHVLLLLLALLGPRARARAQPVRAAEPLVVEMVLLLAARPSMGAPDRGSTPVPGSL